MQWQRVVTRMLVFVVGAGGVAIAVFVAQPWLESSDPAAGGPRSRDTIVEEVFAKCGKPELEGPSETDDRASNTSGAMTIPLVATAAESPARVLSAGMPVVIAGGPLDGVSTQRFGLQRGGWPETTTVAAPESTAKEGEQDAGTGADPVLADQRSGEARAVGALARQEKSSGVSVEADEPMPDESAGAENGAEAVPAAKSVRDAQPRSGRAFRPGVAGRGPSGAVPPRLEFEMPGDFGTVEQPLPTGITLPANEAVERRPEFSTGHLIRSDAAATVEGLSGTARPGKAAADDAERSDPVTVPDTLRGVMGYRLPLVSRLELPDQVVSGVLIPAHSTYVILKPGYWELVGLAPGDVEALRAAVEKGKADQQAVQSEPTARGWNPFRLFRRKQAPAGGN